MATFLRLPRLFTIPLLIALVCLTQIKYDTVRRNHLHTISIAYNDLIEPSVPSVPVLKATTFGLNTVIADTLWLQTIQYYGGGDPYGKYRALPKLMQAIITIDPRFIYPYSFTGLVLSGEGFPDEALQILQEGEKTMPNEWTIPYYEGLIYYINKKDNAKAAESYTRAAEKPGAPALTKFLSAVEYDKTDQNDLAYAIFKNLTDTSDNAYFKQHAQLYVDHYALLHNLGVVIKAFHDKEGHNPNNLDELVQKHYVESIPDDPLNRKIIYDQKTGSVTAEATK